MFEDHGFNQVLRLSKTDRYEGNATAVMLVWHENQVLPAEQYRKAHWPNDPVDIAICEDPNVQKEQLGERAVVYHFA